MNTNLKKLLEIFFENHGFPFDLEKVNEEMYAAKAELTFTEKPFSDDIFVQSAMVDDAITSVCALYTEIADIEMFDSLAEFFMDEYGVSIRYDDKYGAIKASMSVGEESFYDDESGDEELLMCIITFPNLICRMAAYAYFAFEDTELSAGAIFNEIKNDEDLFLCPDIINYDVEHIEEGTERYFVEHIFLPNLFYSDPAEIINNILEDTKFLEMIIEEMLEDNNAELISEYNNFRYETLFENEDSIAIDVVLPEPEKTNDCTDIILFCSESKGANFYTVELDTYTGKKEYHSCSWSENCGHSNYGASKTRDEALKVIKKIICS
ncbi:MAG: hypothetical protein ACI4SF_05240 [Oscillospiraceae bacterium]